MSEHQYAGPSDASLERERFVNVLHTAIKEWTTSNVSIIEELAIDNKLHNLIFDYVFSELEAAGFVPPDDET